MMKVYFNHDGNNDDLVSLLLLLQMDNVEVTGVSVVPADGYLEPSVSASRKIIDRFGRSAPEVAKSNSRGKNPFPASWRINSYYVDALPILNESGSIKAPLADIPAHLHIIRTLRATDEKTVLLFTGPLTDLARALDEDPSIEEKIEKLVWMGGTFLPDGNVEEPEHDGTAEWNAYWDPEAVKRVWDSGIAIDMVALESTNKVPLTPAIRQKWSEMRRHEGIDFVGQCYATVPPLMFKETNSTYYLWDVLTTAYVGRPDLVKTETVHCTVRTEGFEQGRTEKTPDGRPVRLVYDVEAEAFYTYITDLMKQA
ncbi:ABC transporter substrate-binding protein [Paenibacillus sambharensis]|uniref:ABC transporter substrate-binding protein n=1 Tax=Paenibacillus sambharensis TaxID=1803190 RepID=A0A2W1LBR5_9BACL|nr:nucleoside hydrolase [Paenibacillus sambharensis]PZD97658.1 ABC transporter substrate-binding protein [Paenibacillus sambharensis]